VAESFQYKFALDPAKALANLTGHDVGFEQAVTIFRDALAVTECDDKHCDVEERWATLARNEIGLLLVVIHTFAATSANTASVRIISARKATKQEVRGYEAPAR
jgi:uncharacterized DUF497 family protein